MTTGQASCDHCADPIPPGTEVCEEISGEKKKFCCHGCAGAWRIITGAGLSDFYRRRDWRETGVEEEIFSQRTRPEELAHFLVPDEEGKALVFVVDNVRCPTCVWLIEKILARKPGVRKVRASFADHRFRVCFDPLTADPAELLGLVAKLGYRPRPPGREGNNGKTQRAELVRFATAAFFTTHLMVYSLGLYAGFFQGISAEHKKMLQLLSGIVATPVVFYCGLPFIAGAWRGIRNRAPGMDLLVALGVLTAYLYSAVSLFTGGETYFEAAAMIVTLVLLGRLLEGASRRRAVASLDRFISLVPHAAIRIEADGNREVACAELSPGEIILVRNGDRVPVDGIFLDQEGEIDEAVVSGESHPRQVKKGDEILAGSINLGPPARFEVSRASAHSFLARMARLVDEALARRAPVQKTADRVAAVFVPAVIVLAGLTLAMHAALGHPVRETLMAAVAVLVVACPCALGLATPMAMAVALGRAASGGIIFRSGEVIQKTAKTSLVAFDKTGTLTRGRPEILEIIAEAGHDEEEILRLAAAAASLSSHPAARAVCAAAAEKTLATGKVSGREIAGKGVVAEAANQTLLLGSRGFLADHHIDVPAAETDASEICLASEKKLIGRILVADPLRPEAQGAVNGLAAQGISAVILSGDRGPVVAETARVLKIKEFHAAMTPEAKAARINAAVAQGKKVLMAGDGINDGPALAAAQVSCAMGGASDIAVAASDLVLPRPDLRRLPAAIGLARRTMRVVRQNLAWAFSYNLVAIPLAASGHLAPVWAAAAMAASSLLVVTNSIRIR